MRKGAVNELELCSIKPESDREFQLRSRAVFDQGLMQLAIASEIRWNAVDGLLEIANHTKMAGARWLPSFFPPKTGRIRRARDLEENQKLLWICILRFVQDDAVVFFADAPDNVGLSDQFNRECHLVCVGDNAALESEIAIGLLDLCRDAESAGVEPIAHRLESAAPQPNECRGVARTFGQRRELARFAPALFPASQVFLVFGNGPGRRTLCHDAVDLGKIRVGAGKLRLDRAQIERRSPSQLHQLSGLDMTQERAPISFA